MNIFPQFSPGDLIRIVFVSDGGQEREDVTVSSSVCDQVRERVVVFRTHILKDSGLLVFRRRTNSWVFFSDQRRVKSYRVRSILPLELESDIEPRERKKVECLMGFF